MQKIDLSNLAAQSLINKQSQTTIFTFDLWIKLEWETTGID